MTSGYYAAAQQALHQWGAWARRPQFWANLRGCGMYALLPMPRDSRPPRDVRLDPFSRRIHSAVMAMDERDAGVLYSYYVRQVVYDQKPDVFKAAGLARRTYYDVLQRASISAYNRARST